MSGSLSAYLCYALYLSTPWIQKHVLLSGLPRLTSLLQLLSFFSETHQPLGKSVSGSGMWCEWSPHQTLDRPHNSHRYSAHTLWKSYFWCDFFSPLVPFLCSTCLPSLNQYGWLDNFTGLLTPKGTRERESPTPCSFTHSVCSPYEALI